MSEFLPHQLVVMLLRLIPLVLFGATGMFGQGSGSAADGGVFRPVPSNSNAKRYPVSGLVYNSLTGEPVRHALVHLNGPEQHIALTGADGRFQFESIPEGRVFLTAQHPGFLQPPGQAVNERVGGGSNDFRIPLTPQAKITGTVRDSAGDPIEGIPIQMLRSQIYNGRRRWSSGGVTVTDESGMYVVDGQSQGAVLVCTMPRPVLPNSPSNDEVYPQRCYPNTADFASAQPLNTVPGEAVHADFTLESTRAHRVSGVVQGVHGHVYAFVSSGDAQAFDGIPVNPKTGQFVLHAVPDGNWTLHFQAFDPRGSADEQVTVSGADIQGLQVTLAQPINIPIEVVQAQTQSALPVLRLSRRGSTDGREYTSSYRGGPNGKPVQGFEGVDPGDYQLSFQQLTACVGSISSGSVDLLDQPLTVLAGSVAQPITVAMGTNCGSIEVNLQGETANLNCTLLLVPEEAALQPEMVGMGNGSRSHSFPNLRPGIYHVYAVSNADNLEYANPEAMRDIPGQTVSLDSNQKASVTLSVYQRGTP